MEISVRARGTHTPAVWARNHTVLRSLLGRHLYLILEFESSFHFRFQLFAKVYLGNSR